MEKGMREEEKGKWLRKKKQGIKERYEGSSIYHVRRGGGGGGGGGEVMFGRVYQCSGGDVEGLENWSNFCNSNMRMTPYISAGEGIGCK